MTDVSEILRICGFEGGTKRAEKDKCNMIELTDWRLRDVEVILSSSLNVLTLDLPSSF